MNAKLAVVSEIQAWKAAHLRFETPAVERARFLARLKSLGVGDWDRDLQIILRAGKRTRHQ